MERIAFIQINEEGKPYSPSGAAAARGFAFLGYEVRFFRSAELMDLPLTPMTVVVGGVRTVQNALEKLGARVPFVSAPSSLMPYMGRACWQTTIGNIREAGQYPVFVKPYDESKIFNGLVVTSEDELDSLLRPREGFPTIGEDLRILAQEPVTFVSEWRAFVKHGIVLGMSHYAGDPLLFPSPGVIRLVLGAYQGAPKGYSADFGLTDEGRTLLVEVNDGYALGQGGLVANLYAELLQARWEEMTDA